MQDLLTARLSLLVVCLLARPASLQAVEDPPGCSLANGGLGNTSQGGINFNLKQAHVGDTVRVFPSLGMVANACRAIDATGVVYVAPGLLVNFLEHVNLDPGVLISCPGTNVLCTPGPYNLTITAPMVGAAVSSPNGIAAGEPRTVRAVQNGLGTVKNQNDEQLSDFHTASIQIVTPCLQVFKTCDLLPGQNCLIPETPVRFRGYVTNCGDIQMTNVVVSNSRAAQLFSATPPFFPLLPLTLSPGQAAAFTGSFQPTLAETCAGSVSSTTTVRGTYISIIGGPNASVTNTSTSTCRICVNPCLTVTKNCDSVVLGSLNTVSGFVTNCGNIAITNLVIADDLYGTLATIPSLASGVFHAYRVQVTNPTCGNFPNVVIAAGTTLCGGVISAQATNTCLVTESPCIRVTADCAPVMIGALNPVSGVVSNCGNVTLTNILISSSLYGPLASIVALAPGATNSYLKLVTNTCGSFPNTVTAAGLSTCGTPVSTTATNTCSVDCPPCLQVEKQVACIVGTNCGTFGKEATGMKGDNQDPAFCYRISITNCGSISLTNVQVLDDQLGDLTASYFAGPTTAFPVGDTITRFFRAAGSTSTTNTVVTSGQSSLNGSGASATNRAVALVVQASLTCSSMKASSPDDRDGNANDNRVSLRQDGLAHPVTFTITATSGDAPMVNVQVTSPALAALGCALPTISLAANSSSNLSCTVPVNCDQIPGGTLTLIATINGLVDMFSGACAYDTNGQPIAVSSANSGRLCSAVVKCLPLSCLGDFVWEDLNRNGLQDAGEPGLSNVVVRLLACDSTNVLATTTTRSNGNYQFCGLEAGSYQVQVGLPDNYQFTFQNAGTNDCLDSDADPTTGITDCTTWPAGVDNLCTDIGLVRPACLGDQVWVDLNGDGLQDPGEPGRNGVTVQLSACGSTNVLATANTSGDGNYLFCGLTPGAYQVRFLPPAGYVFTLPDAGANECADSDASASPGDLGLSACVTLSSGETNLCTDAGLKPLSCLGDYVWEDLNYNGLQEAGEPGLANAVVHLLACGSTNVLRTQTTSSHGYFLFCDLEAGSYRVQVVPPDGYGFTLQNTGANDCLDSDADPATGITDCTTLPFGVTNRCTDIGLYRPACLGDQVWVDLNGNGVQDAGEPGIAGATAQLYACGSTNVLATQTTSADGRYRFCGLTPGAYQVRFVAPAGYVFTVPDAGNDCVDSDASTNPGDLGMSACVTLVSGETNFCTDAGVEAVPPCIQVTKTVACLLPNNACGPFGKVATSTKGDAQNPAFCYTITIRNCSRVALTNVTVNDNQLGALTNYPGTLEPGRSVTSLFKKDWAVNTTNTVVATGQSALTGELAEGTDSAVALVFPASIMCNLQVTSPHDLDGNPADDHVSLLADGAAHPVTFKIIATAGSVPLANVTLTSPSVVALGCLLPPPFSLAAHTSVTNTCTVAVNCANLSGGVLTNVAILSGVVDSSGGLCGYGLDGQPITVVSTSAGPPCAAVIQCVALPRIFVAKFCPVVLAVPGGLTTISGVVSNAGNITLTNVLVFDDQPARSTLVLGPISLLPHQAVFFTNAYLLPPNCCLYIDTVRVSGLDQFSGRTVTDSATAACRTAPTARLTVTKNCPALLVPPHGMLNFSGSVSNAGDITLTNVIVVNDHSTNNTPVLGPVTLAPNESLSYSGSYRTCPECCPPYVDTIRVSGAQICDGSNVSASATASCPGISHPQLELSVDCPAAPAQLGQLLFYSGAVSNSGDVTVASVEISDDKSGFLTEIPALAPRETSDFFGFYLATNCGPSVTTVVTATAYDVCTGAGVSSQSSASCAITCPPNELVLINPVITSDGQQFQFSFASEPGRTYILQYTDTMLPANWQTLPGAILGDGRILTIYDTLGSQNRCYRVMAK